MHAIALNSFSGTSIQPKRLNILPIKFKFKVKIYDVSMKFACKLIHGGPVHLCFRPVYAASKDLGRFAYMSCPQLFPKVLKGMISH